MIVLERVSEATFTVYGEAPEWFVRLCPEATSPEPFEPGQRFAFLEAFLFDAEQFWIEPTTDSVKSGPWIEVGDDGLQHYLEATAVRVGERCLLIVELPRIPYEEHLAVIQTGRETSLERDAMMREIQKKEILLHCIVHDLKGPLSGIVGSVSLLAGKETLPGQKEFLELALRQSSRLELLIQGILSAFSAEIEALEQFTFDPAAAPDALETIGEAALAMAPAYKLSRASLEIDPEIDPNADWRVVGEKVRLDRVLQNLIGNALRYSPKGSTVTLGLSTDGDLVTFTVDDQGPGVPEEVRGRLFQKFSQGGTKAGSAGLGLYFCRMTVERWGGEIGYEPRDGSGSRFWFRLQRASRHSG